MNKKLFLLFLVLLFSISFATAIPTTDLRAYYPINETSGTTISDDGTGTFSKDFVFNSGYATFKSGADCNDGNTCLAFEGSQASELNGDPTRFMPDGKNYTFYMWIKPQSPGTDAEDVFVGQPDGLIIKTDASNTNIITEVRPDTGYPWINANFGSLASLTDTWHLYSATWDLSTGNLTTYVDCVQIDSDTGDGYYDSPAQYSGIGGKNKNNAVANGTYQHLAVYETIHSTSVCNDYYLATGGVVASTNHTYYFEDTAGAQVTDEYGDYDGVWLNPYEVSVYNTTNPLQGAQSAYFDGDTSIIIPYNNVSNKNFTNLIGSIWIYATNPADSIYQQQAIFEVQDNVGIQTIFQVRDSNRFTIGDIQWYQHTVTQPLNQWYHAVWWVNGSSVGFYINNGTEYTQTKSTGGYGTILGPDRNINLGFSANSFGRYQNHSMWDCLTFSQDPVTADLINTYKNLTCSSGEAPTPTDTCTYTSGDHTYQCADNCVLSSTQTVDASSTIIINGTGTFTGVGYLSGASTIRIQGGCDAKR